MFREAMGYPTRPPNGGRAVFVGGILLVAVFLAVAATQLGWPYGLVGAAGLVPWLLVRGYCVRVVRTTIGRREPSPPSFANKTALLTDGATAVGISVAYLLPAAVVLGPLAAVQLLGNDLSAPVAGLPAPVVDGILSGVGFIAVFALMYLVGALYVLPVAVARFAYTGQVAEAFDVRAVVSGAMTEDYATAWFVSVTLQFFVLPVAYLLRIILVGFLLQFVVAAAVRYCYGQGVGEAMDWTPVESDDEAIPWDELTPAVTRVSETPAVDRDAPGAAADRRGYWPETTPAIVHVGRTEVDNPSAAEAPRDRDKPAKAEENNRNATEAREGEGWVPASEVTLRRREG